MEVRKVRIPMTHFRFYTVLHARMLPFLLHRQMILAILAANRRSRDDNFFYYFIKVVSYLSLESICLNPAGLEVSRSRYLESCPL